MLILDPYIIHTAHLQPSVFESGGHVTEMLATQETASQSANYLIFDNQANTSLNVQE